MVLIVTYMRQLSDFKILSRIKVQSMLQENTLTLLPKENRWKSVTLTMKIVSTVKRTACANYPLLF